MRTLVLLPLWAGCVANVENTGPCPDYSGIRDLGSWRSYSATLAEVVQSGSTNSFTLTTTRVDDARIRLAYEGEWDGQSGGGTLSMTLYYQCDRDGAWLVEQEMFQSFDAGGYAESVVGYDPPLRIMKTFADPGDTWEQTVTQSSSAAGDFGEAALSDTPHTVSFELGELEVLEVPAGTFQVMPLTRTTSSADGTFTSVAYVERGLGIVLSDVEQLVDYSR